MKLKIIICLSFLLTSLTVFSQVKDSLKIDKLDKKKIENIEDEIEKEQKNLQRTLIILEDSVDKSAELRKVIKEANQVKYLSYVNTLELRYEAGEEVIHHIIKETNSFNLSFSQLLLHAEFSALSDPTFFSDFNKSVNTSFRVLDDRRPFPTAGDINSLKEKLPVLDNPIVMSGMSIASFFLAKYHKKRDVQEEELTKLMCILNYTNAVKSEYDIIKAQLISISSRLDNFNNATKLFFSEYLNEIGYQKGYGSDYLDEQEKMYRLKEHYFEDLKSERDNIGVVSYDTSSDNKLLYRMEQVKYYLNEYELILLEIKAFIDNYADFIAKIEKLSKNSCGLVQEETKRTFESIKEQLGIVQKNFKTVYEENRISDMTKRRLFGY